MKRPRNPTLNDLSPWARRQVSINFFAQDELKKIRANKFGATKTPLDGVQFDSKGESERYAVLKLEQIAGLISDLKIQVKFPIEINGELICYFIADFCYIRDGTHIAEDWKSPATMTPVYRIKKKLVKAVHGIDILETMRKPPTKKRKEKS